MDQPKKKKKDPYRGLKYLGYRMSQLPDTYTLDQLVKFAKFQLAERTRRLMKDPIWDEYTIEEILIEYFAHMFATSEKARVEFETTLNTFSAAVDDFSDWADREMAKEAKIRDTVLGGLEDSVSFDPKNIMGDDE